MEEKLEEFRQLIDECEKIIFFGGAGVSTASGIPDFRSSSGLFVADQGYHVEPEKIVSLPFFQDNPKAFFEFYFDKLIYSDAEPNVAHHFAAELEKSGKQLTVITQNIDGLHQQAGSYRVLELHGNVWHNTCTHCGRQYSLCELHRDQDGIPRCPHDHHIIKPDVVLYEEPLDTDVIDIALHNIEEADLLIIAGTSLVVQPAASLVHYFKGKKIVVVNQTPLPIFRPDVLSFEMDMNTVFSEVMPKQKHA